MTDFIRVCKTADVPDPGREVFELDDRFIVLIHLDGQWHALEDRCTHDGGPLGEGRIDGFCIVCPRHGARFDVRTGQAMTMPAVSGTPRHEVKIEGDDVFVKLR